MSKNKNDSKGVNISSEDGINSCGSLSYEVAFTPDSVPPVNETDSGGSIGGKGNADVPLQVTTNYQIVVRMTCSIG